MSIEKLESELKKVTSERDALKAAAEVRSVWILPRLLCCT